MSHKKSRWGAAAMAIVLAALAGGCGTGREFRAIAGPAVQTGVSSILNGLLDGVFAVIAPDPTTNANTTN